MRDFELDECDDRIAYIEAALRQQIEDGVRFSADKKTGFVYIADELRTFELHPAFTQAFVDDLNAAIREKRSWKNKIIVNLGDLIELFHRISKVNDFLSRLIERFDTDSFDNDFSDEMTAQITLYNYCIRLRGHLSAISAILAAKHTRKEGAINLQSVFCVFCWRRARQSVRDSNDNKPRDSMYYCHEHHPSQNEAGYNSAVNALVNAVRNENADEFRSDLSKYDHRDKKAKARVASMYSRWFKSFLLRIPPVERSRSNVQSDLAWLDIAFWLCEKAVAVYPLVAERIDYSFNPPPNSWREWVLKVIELLDDKKQTELQYWRDNIVEDQKSNESSLVDPMSQYLCDNKDKDWTRVSEWQTILHLFARYEAYHYIQENRPKIGRPGGKKELAVEFILGCYKNSQYYPTINEICKAIDITKSTASKALKEARKLSKNITSE